MTLKSIMFMLIMAFMLSAAAAVAASAADLYRPGVYGSGSYAQCVAAAHKVISQHEATKVVLRDLKSRRPATLDAHVEAADDLIVPGIIMPEELRAQLIAARVAECRQIYG